MMQPAVAPESYDLDLNFRRHSPADGVAYWRMGFGPLDDLAQAFRLDTIGAEADVYPHTERTGRDRVVNAQQAPVV